MSSLANQHVGWIPKFANKIFMYYYSSASTSNVGFLMKDLITLYNFKELFFNKISAAAQKKIFLGLCYIKRASKKTCK